MTTQRTAGKKTKPPPDQAKNTYRERLLEKIWSMGKLSIYIFESI